RLDLFSDALFCLITDKIDKELLDAAGPSLKVIGTMSVGHDHIDVPEVKKRGIQVGFTPNVLTNATAETTVAVLLAASRRMFEAREELLNGGWAKSAWGPEYLCGQELTGSTVGIYGMGRIGQAVMKRLKAFDVAKFLYSGRTPKPELEKEASFVDFDTLCKNSDFVIVTCSLTPETKEIFNERAFSLMKPNCVFVNTSRGGTVDQEALMKALKSNQIFSAGLDVMTPEPLPTDHELTKIRNCVVVPHIGSATFKARTDMATITAKNIIAALEGTPMPAKLC
ncbi:Glyoxylate reductase/hydroxypyruvate reductase, partial [Orchesella cincta]